MSATNDQIESLISADPEAVKAEEARYGLSQFQLMWRKFKRSRAAIIGGIVVILLYLMALFANFLAPYGGDQRNTDISLCSPHGAAIRFQYRLLCERIAEKNRSGYAPDHLRCLA